MTGEVFIGGHSLGGARAYQYAYSRLARGLRVDGVYALAPPRPGNHAIGQMLAKSSLTILALWNRRDLVPAVPIDMECFGEEYEQPWATTEINEAPTPDLLDDIDPDHHIALYVAGAHKLAAAAIGGAIDVGTAADYVSRLYDTAAGWDWLNPTDGAYWGMKVMPNGAKLMIARGTKTAKEWLQDFDAIQIDVLGARMGRGFWQGVEPVQAQLDKALA